MKIGNVNIEKYGALAPMAGVGDRAFREICVEQGASFVVGEMVSAKGLTYHSAKSAQLLVMSEAEKPCAVQIFGSEPQVIVEAIAYVLPYNPEIIDINMGCPAPKIVGGGNGAALMKDLDLAGRIIGAAVKASPVPVTVKFRKGWDESTVNAVELGKICEAQGAAAVTVHGRTRRQMYAPPVDLDIIKAVKEAISIPVIGNGGIETPQDAQRMYNYTGCDLVMIGQGALGRPWIFRQIRDYLSTGKISPSPTTKEKMAVLRRQVVKACEYKGERTALRESRTHAGWYMHGLRGAAKLRSGAGKLTTLEELDRFIELVLEENREQ